MVKLTIAVESPLVEEVRGLIRELNDVLLVLTPPEHCYHMTAEEMAQPETTVFVGRIGGQAVGMGALRCHGQVGEVKRMYTRPSYQGRGIGGRILMQIEILAWRKGLRRLVLETGDRHPAAWRVYERAGFSRCPPVLDYPASSWSVFYEKGLVREPVAT